MRAKTWVHQSNLGNERDAGAVAAACKRLGVEFLPVRHIPFAGSLPLDVFRAEQPAVAYGAVSFVRACRSAERVADGLSLAPHWTDKFDCREYATGWGILWLNAQGMSTTFGEFVRIGQHSPVDGYFVRPCSDEKEFSGAVLTPDEVRRWAANMPGEALPPSTPCWVARPSSLLREWRVFVAFGQVVAGSLYRSDGQLDVRPEVPSPVRDLALEADRTWRPANVYVLDICEPEDDDLRVLEAGCIHSAGFYAADVGTIVEAMTRR